MAQNSGTAATMHTRTSDDAAAAACVACSLIATGAIAAIVGMMRRTGGPRRWPAQKASPEPADFTPPHGDKLPRHR